MTLLAISSGRVRNYILDSNELEKAKDEKTFLANKIKTLSFSSTDLSPMDDLELIDVFIETHKESNSDEENEPVGSVLYLTDNNGILPKIPRKQLGVPLAWRKDGIQLTVLTTAEAGCTPWKQRAEATCFQVLRKNQSDEQLKTELQNRLDQFLQAE